MYGPFQVMLSLTWETPWPKLSNGVLESVTHWVVTPPGAQAGASRNSLAYYSLRVNNSVMGRPLEGTGLPQEVDTGAELKQKKGNTTFCSGWLNGVLMVKFLFSFVLWCTQAVYRWWGSGSHKTAYYLLFWARSGVEKLWGCQLSTWVSIITARHQRI